MKNRKLNNCCYFLTLSISLLLLGKLSFCQTHQYFDEKAPSAIRIKTVYLGDTLVITSDTAFILNAKAYDSFRQLANQYLICLADRENELKLIQDDLEAIANTFLEIELLLSQHEKMNKEIISDSRKRLNNLLSTITENIETLEKSKELSTRALADLEETKKLLKKEKRRIFRTSVFSHVLCGSLCFIGGALLL